MYVIQTLLYVPMIIALFFIGGLTYLRRKSPGVTAFFLTTFTTAIWLSWQALAQLNINPSLNVIFIRLSIATSIFIGYFLLLFFRGFTNKKTGNIWEIILLLPCLILAVINLTAYGVNDVAVSALGISVNDMPISYVLLLLLLGVYVIYGLVILIINTIKKPKNERATNYLIMFGFGEATVINLIILFFYSSSAVAQYAIILSILAFIAIIAFAIIRHRLFDIRLVAVRAVTYSLTIGVIALLYGLIAFRVSSIFLNKINPQLQEGFYIILTVIFAFTFAPLRRFFERISNKIFYRDRYDSQALVNEIGRILASEIDLDKVSSRVLRELSKQIKIEKAEIVVFGENQLFYENNVFKNGDGKISPNELSKLGRVMLVVDDLQSGERKELMQKYGITISLALRTSEKFIGYMLLGEKKSGDIYNDQDLAVLKIIANEVSVAMANALSYKEIQLFSETLAEKVRQRTAQLRHANDQLKELDKAKDEFISMASHQLRTPLTTVKGYASMLEEGDFGKLTKEQSKIVEQTLDGSNRMARLIDDLLNVSRMDANRFFLEGNQVDLNKLVPEELEQLKSFAEGKNVKLTYEPPKQKIPVILLDENKTRQVVMNLVDNALHYSAPPNGGGHVRVSLVLNGDFVEFWVADDGIGVPEAVQKKLFTKMFRAPNAQGVRPDGTGLGLYLVKRVVEQQGGEIWFESKEGKGSTFGFKLPLSGIPKAVLEESKKIGAKVAASHAKAGN